MKSLLQTSDRYCQDQPRLRSGLFFGRKGEERGAIAPTTHPLHLPL
ncbi:MAG: hypothetical protein SWX82_00970 [Cyanobacteriota bacterium]|nr:hypothetical protein [Cyanobacteriota bacterium]